MNVLYTAVTIIVILGCALMCMLSLRRGMQYAKYESTTGTVVSRKIFGVGKSAKFSYTVTYYYNGVEYENTCKATHMYIEEGMDKEIMVNPQNPSQVMFPSSRITPFIHALLWGVLTFLCVIGG